jgi:hypothetical protein
MCSVHTVPWVTYTVITALHLLRSEDQIATRPVLGRQIIYGLIEQQHKVCEHILPRKEVNEVSIAGNAESYAGSANLTSSIKIFFGAGDTAFLFRRGGRNRFVE